MKTEGIRCVKRHTVLLLAMVMVFCLCACGQTATPQPQKDVASYYQKIGIDGYPVLTVEHGEDYVIEWEDPGMEAHVRLWLDRPEGDIYHSDVWEIRLIYISVMANSPYDMIFEQPPEGRTTIGGGGFVTLEDLRIYYDRTDLLPIKCLADLRHFDSLEYVSVNCDPKDPITDISGPEECVNLLSFSIDGAKPESLKPLSKMESLLNLTLDDCGTVDLTHISGLQNLRDLSLQKVRVESLEPLTGMQLNYLKFTADMFSQDWNAELDYSPLAEIDSLRQVIIMSNTGFDREDCELLLTELDDLEQIDISYTAAADHLDELREQYPDISIVSYGTLD